MADKKTLRRVYLEKRLLLSKVEFDERSKLLLRQIKQHINFNDYKYLHTFLPIIDKREINTWSIIQEARSVNPEIQIGVSKSLPQGQLRHFLLEEGTRIVFNKWGIPEPEGAEELPPATFDLVMVPLISFDKVGHRIGYGKGYYDRFLKLIPAANKVGLSISPPVDMIPYVEKNDLPLNSCITPFRVYSF